jgi:hypothetical protein
MPWVDENGLLPGRGPLGLGAPGPAGRGAGVAVPPSTGAAGAGDADAAGACGAAGASGAAGAAAGGADSAAGADGVTVVSAGAGEPFGDSSRDWARGAAGGPGTAAGASPSATATDEPAALAAFLAAALAARAAFASAAAFHSGPLVSSSRRTTGASTVDEADLTNSPISLSASSTFLLGTPNSLASSWTLAFPATILLLGWSDPRRARTYLVGVLIA